MEGVRTICADCQHSSDKLSDEMLMLKLTVEKWGIWFTITCTTVNLSLHPSKYVGRPFFYYNFKNQWRWPSTGKEYLKKNLNMAISGHFQTVSFSCLNSACSSSFIFPSSNSHLFWYTSLSWLLKRPSVVLIYVGNLLGVESLFYLIPL